MKLITIIGVLALSINAMAGVAQDLIATCVRADSGDSPEVKVFANSDKSYGLIMLNTGGVEEFSHSKFFMENANINVKGSVDEYNGVDVSITLPTQLETTTETFSADLVIHGDTDNIEPWLRANTNLSDPKLGHEDVSVAMVCKQVNM